MKSYFPLIGRILFSQIFLLSGIKKMLDFESSWKYMELNGLPLAPLLLLMAILIEFGAGMLLLVGFQVKFGAFMLILFLIPTTLIFHTDFSNPIESTNFVKNIALIGALFIILYHGAGPKSIDADNG